MAFDTHNYLWYTTNTNSTRSSTLATNTLDAMDTSDNTIATGVTGGGLYGGAQTVIDSANHVWVLNFAPPSTYCSNNVPNIAVTFVPFDASSASPVTPPTAIYPLALGADLGACLRYGGPMFVDSSGSVWMGDAVVTVHDAPSNVTFQIEAITRLLGIAAPTKTPSVGPPVAP